MERSGRHPIFSLLGLLTACYALCLIASEGGLRGLAGWYMAIEKPGWSLPPALYCPIWTILFGLAGVAAWFALRDESDQKGVPLTLLGVSLVIATVWPWLLFDLQLQFPSALLAGGLCFITLLACLLSFRISKTTGLLLLPLVLWALYSTALSIEIWRLNAPQQAVRSGR